MGPTENSLCIILCLGIWVMIGAFWAGFCEWEARPSKRVKTLAKFRAHEFAPRKSCSRRHRILRLHESFWGGMAGAGVPIGVFHVRCILVSRWRG
jgi:hypothetical protein